MSERPHLIRWRLASVGAAALVTSAVAGCGTGADGGATRPTQGTVSASTGCAADVQARDAAAQRTAAILDAIEAGGDSWSSASPVSVSLMSPVDLAAVREALDGGTVSKVTLAYAPFRDDTTYYVTYELRSGSAVDDGLVDLRAQMRADLNGQIRRTESDPRPSPAGTARDASAMIATLRRVDAGELPVIRLTVDGQSAARFVRSVEGLGTSVAALAILETDGDARLADDAATRRAAGGC